MPFSLRNSKFASGYGSGQRHLPIIPSTPSIKTLDEADQGTQDPTPENRKGAEGSRTRRSEASASSRSRSWRFPGTQSGRGRRPPWRNWGEGRRAAPPLRPSSPPPARLLRTPERSSWVSPPSVPPDAPLPPLLRRLAHLPYKETGRIFLGIFLCLFLFWEYKMWWEKREKEKKKEKKCNNGIRKIKKG